MDPFTLALATFGVQKLRGKSTRTALQSAALVGGASYGLGALGSAGKLGSFSQSATSMFSKPAFSSLGFGATQTTTPGLQQQNIFQRAIGKKAQPEALKAAIEKLGPDASTESIKALTEQFGGSGFRGLGGGEKLFLASTALPIAESLFGGEEEAPKPAYTEEDYKKAYAEQSAKLQGAFQPVKYSGGITSYAPQSIYTYNQGGLAEIKKFNEGGVNYLPSKMTHNEQDYNNYRRASGYVEDGSGSGDKDEDTMLAQLADGEFVSRTDAVLGAGILSGASPRDMKDMRSKGANFFYDQQKKFKRIFDLVNASKAD
jgi:hypothetical protein